MAASSRAMPSPGRVGTRSIPSRSGRIGSARKASRRSGVQPGGSYGNSMNGPPPTPAATCRLASSPIPFVQVCGVNQRLRASASSAEGPRPEHPGRQDDVGLVDVERVRVERGQRLGERPGHLAAGDAHAGRRRAQRGQPGAGPCRPAAPPPTARRTRRAARRSARAATGSSDARHVAGHPPALVEVDHDRHRVADRGAGRGDGREALVEARGSTRILSARNPSSRRRSADSARAAAGSSMPHDA